MSLPLLCFISVAALVLLFVATVSLGFVILSLCWYQTSLLNVYGIFIEPKNFLACFKFFQIENIDSGNLRLTSYVFPHVLDVFKVSECWYWQWNKKVDARTDLSSVTCAFLLFWPSGFLQFGHNKDWIKSTKSSVSMNLNPVNFSSRSKLTCSCPFPSLAADAVVSCAGLFTSLTPACCSTDAVSVVYSSSICSCSLSELLRFQFCPHLVAVYTYCHKNIFLFLSALWIFLLPMIWSKIASIHCSMKSPCTGSEMRCVWRKPKAACKERSDWSRFIAGLCSTAIEPKKMLVL